MEEITLFRDVYSLFLKITTPTMYVSMDINETISELQTYLLIAISKFEYPKKNIREYELLEPTIIENWIEENGAKRLKKDLDDDSYFYCELDFEEKMILAYLMMVEWLHAQTINQDNIDLMVGGSSDAKIPSQSAHLKTLENLLEAAETRCVKLKNSYAKKEKTKDGYSYSVFGDMTLTHQQSRSRRTGGEMYGRKKHPVSKFDIH